MLIWIVAVRAQRPFIKTFCASLYHGLKNQGEKFHSADRGVKLSSPLAFNATKNKRDINFICVTYPLDISLARGLC